jgi:hypothetical protein
LIVKVGPFCRKGLSPQGEQCVDLDEDRNWLCQSNCTVVAASREVLLGKEDLPKSATTPLWPRQRMPA